MQNLQLLDQIESHTVQKYHVIVNTYENYIHKFLLLIDIFGTTYIIKWQVWHRIHLVQWCSQSFKGGRAQSEPLTALIEYLIVLL